MGAIKELLTELMGELIEKGRADRVLDRPHATDEELWKEAQRVLPSQYGMWHIVEKAIATHTEEGGQLRLDLAELREWYEDGRLPGRCDLNLVARSLRSLGYEAEVVNESGGTYLVHVGPYFLDGEGEQRPAVSAGGDAWSGAMGEIWCDIDGMSFGTGDPAVPEAEKVSQRLDAARLWTCGQIALEIGKAVAAECKRRGYDPEKWAEHQEKLGKRIDAAVQVAEGVFWEAIAAAFPEISGGELCPATAMAFEQHMLRVVTSWAEENAPNDGPWAAGTSIEPTTTLRIRREQLAAWTGRTLTDDDVRALDDAVPHSSIPEALCLMASELQVGEPDQPEDDGSCGRCGARDRRRCDCVAHLCDDECGDPSHPRDGRTVYVDPTADQMPHLVDLTVPDEAQGGCALDIFTAEQRAYIAELEAGPDGR